MNFILPIILIYKMNEFYFANKFSLSNKLNCTTKLQVNLDLANLRGYQLLVLYASVLKMENKNLQPN